MSVESFLDTKILVYAVGGGESENDKRARALELIENQDFGVSAQVLQEFYVTVTRKLAVPLSPEQALEWIKQFESFPCVAVDSGLAKVAVEISERYRISYWDGAIVAAAVALDAATLYTEELNAGQRYESLRVANPFGEATP